MPDIQSGLAAMLEGSATAQTGLNNIPSTDDLYADLTALQAITTQLQAMQKKYAES